MHGVATIHPSAVLRAPTPGRGARRWPTWPARPWPPNGTAYHVFTSLLPIGPGMAVIDASGLLANTVAKAMSAT